MAGTKHDNGKPDLSLIPYSALIEEARGFMFGANKYGRFNYTKGLEASRLVAACLRHLHAWNQGEDTDGESGVSHLGHARCCLSMLLECTRLKTLTDDRMGRAAPEQVPSGYIPTLPVDQVNTITYIPTVAHLDSEISEHRGISHLQITDEKKLREWLDANRVMDYIK